MLWPPEIIRCWSHISLILCPQRILTTRAGQGESLGFMCPCWERNRAALPPSHPPSPRPSQTTHACSSHLPGLPPSWPDLLKVWRALGNAFHPTSPPPRHGRRGKGEEKGPKGTIEKWPRELPFCHWISNVHWTWTYPGPFSPWEATKENEVCSSPLGLRFLLDFAAT